MEASELKGYTDRGLSFEAIGRLVGLDPSTVAYWARKHGLASPFAGKHAARGPLDREQLEALVAQGRSVREIATAVDRSPTTVRHWLGLHGLRTAGWQRPPQSVVGAPARITRDCRRHGMTEFVRTGRAGRYRCRLCRAAYRTERRRRVKRVLVAEAGGQCVRCGYAGPPAAMHFHHLNRDGKAFGLSALGVGRSLRAARAEAAKCVLLCANCHAEVEASLGDGAKEARSRAVVRRRRRVKAILVQEAGGACERCGYGQSLAGLQFHHRDPATKAFGLSQAGVTRSLERSRAEARKCTLLCANCHAEVEWSGANLPVVHGCWPMHPDPG
jgi:transposase